MSESGGIRPPDSDRFGVTIEANFFFIPTFGMTQSLMRNQLSPLFSKAKDWDTDDRFFCKLMKSVQIGTVLFSSDTGASFFTFFTKWQTFYF